MAIDYGTRRTGIAVSDPLRLIAGGLDTVATHELMPMLKKYMAENQVDIIVVGKPLRLSGEPSDTFAQAQQLAAKLQKEFPDSVVVMYDERFSSTLAHRAMLEGGMKKMQRRDKAAVDKISATIILQDFMESRDYSELNDG